MQQFLKKNFTLVLAFLLPVILIIIVASSAYLPSLFFSTNYNFVYASCGDNVNRYPYNCQNYLKQLYSVNNNKITVNTVNTTQDSDGDGTLDINESYTGRIFLHDTRKNESREITLEEAQHLNLNTLLTSPDGVTISSDYTSGSDFLFFGTGSNYGFYLTKGRLKSKLNLINHNDRYYYRDNFHFIGWVLP